MLIVVVLTVRREFLYEFRYYEAAAAQIMVRYGGAIERAIVLDAGDPDTLRELHVVRFPDEPAFAAYRNDSELGQLGGIRERAVIATEIWPAEDGPSYT